MILRITFGVVAHNYLRRKAQPWLRDELRKATIDGNEPRMSYLMGSVDDGKVEALVKAQGGHIHRDTMDLSKTGIIDRHLGMLEALIVNASVKKIDLSSNSIGSEGTQMGLVFVGGNGCLGGLE